MKSYLAGNPAISLALNDSLTIGRREGASASHFGGANNDDPNAIVSLDDCNFHESVSLDRFEADRTLELLKPPDGEFALMNYRYHLIMLRLRGEALPEPSMQFACNYRLVLF